MNHPKECDLARKILLSIAGFDPSSGAGISLDLRVFQKLGFHGMAILTSLTSQNTQGVNEVYCLPPDFLWQQYEILSEDVSFSGIKLGMVGSKKNTKIIARILSKHVQIPRVLDPVFKSSSGAYLIEEDAIPDYVRKIKGKATLLTPNLDEASLIAGMKINRQDDMKKAAKVIFERVQCPCLIKGGHLQEDISDILFDGTKCHVFERKRIDKKVHGTGCFLSSSLLAYIVRGLSLEQAVWQALDLTHKALETSVQMGQGQHIIDFA